MKKQAKITSKGKSPCHTRFAARWASGRVTRWEFEKDDAGFHIRPVRTESPFAKYAGIGNPGIPRGKKAILRYIREMRGHDDGD